MHTHEDLVSVEPKRGIERGHIGNPHTRVEHVDEILHVFRGPLSKAWAWRVILKTISAENWTSVAKAGNRCDCPITASGTLQRRFRRRTTGAWEWEAARAVVEAWERSGTWSAPGLILE